MPGSLPDRRSVLRAALFGVGAVGLGACTANPYRSGPSGGGATTGAVPTQATGREVEFQGATYRVPPRATRVVTLGDASLQPVLDVAGPVVATSSIALATMPPSRRPAVREIPVVGRGREGDPITAADVAEHTPDLVFAAEGTPRDLVTEVGRDVPVVLVRTSGEFRRDWQSRVGGVAEILGSDALPGLLASYRGHADRIRQRHAATLERVRVVVLRAWDTERITAYGPDSAIGAIYADAGVRFVPTVQGEAARAAGGEVDDAKANVSRYLQGADIVMLASDYAGGLDAFTGGSLATSDAVTGHVRRTGAVLTGAGVLAVTSFAQVHYILDRLDEALTAAAA